MTNKEYQEITSTYQKENDRWSKINPGDTVIEQVSRFFDYEYYDIIVDEVNREERYIIGRDTSQNDKVRKLYGFLTEEEYNNLPNYLK